MNWHYEVLPPQTKKALDILSAEAWLAESKWYLAGGTALALQAGTRRSYDLDFFTSESEFNGEMLLANFLKIPDWRTESHSSLACQYPSVAHNYHHILKSLVYFQDADSDPDPVFFFQASWEGIRSFFQKEMPQIARTLIIQDG